MNAAKLLENLDNPIRTFEEDLLRRGAFISNLAKIVGTAPQNESNVFAVYGPWGSGKTSINNLLRLELEKLGERSPLIVNFNPWAFSGQDQLLEAFFSEVGKGIGENKSGSKAAQGFKKLGAYLSYGAKPLRAVHIGMDVFGIPGSKIVGWIGEQLQAGSKDARELADEFAIIGKASLEDVQMELKSGLSALGRSVLIVLDDLDRLTPDQVLQVFQIIKINASLPNVNFLLLMDQGTIQTHLNARNMGSEYLEKIVQFDFSIPYVSQQDLKEILKQGFTFVMGSHARSINWERWEEAWTNGCENVFTTLRHIKRFLHTLRFHVTLFTADEVLEVDPVDLFLVEVLRTFARELHSEIPRVFRKCIYQSQWMSQLMWQTDRQEAVFGEAELKSLLELVPDYMKPEVERIMRVMFPQVGRAIDSRRDDEWIRDRRVCHELFFEAYFRLEVPREAPTRKEVQQVFQNAGDKLQLRNALKTLYEKFGLNRLLLSIHCHYSELKAEHLMTFLTELWRLDEHDAQAAGVERKWETRGATQSLSVFLIRQYCRNSERVQLAIKAMQDSDTVYPLARIVAIEKRHLQENPHVTDTAFDMPGLESLRSAVVAEIRRQADRGTLIDSPDSGDILFTWTRLESAEAVREWVQKTIQDIQIIPRLMSRLIFKAISSSAAETRIHYYITRQALETFFSLDEPFESALQKIDTTTLGHWERFAVTEALKRIQEKKAGITEPTYRE